MLPACPPGIMTATSLAVGRLKQRACSPVGRRFASMIICTSLFTACNSIAALNDAMYGLTPRRHACRDATVSARRLGFASKRF